MCPETLRASVPARQKPGMRVGIFGGTFDPIHCGHLRLAEMARDLVRLDQIFFITSVQPPHKSNSTSANFLDRHAMVALALAGQAEFIPSSLEYERSGKSYSVDTLRHFRNIMPEDVQLFFLIGIDAFLDISTWKEHHKLLELCDFLVFSRPGFETLQLQDKLPEEWISRIRGNLPSVDMERWLSHGVFCVPGLHSPISATGIRHRIRQGNPIDGMVPAAVAEYINKTGLYR
jgi:nicotinate-nucleotide adenylyltransferase